MFDFPHVPRQVALGMFLAAALGLCSGCSDSVVAPPTDSLQANPSSGPSLQPRMASAAPAETGGLEVAAAEMPGNGEQAELEEISPVRPVDDLGENFYETAAKAAADAAEGSQVPTDSRSDLELTTARLDHPELTSFRRMIKVPDLKLPGDAYSPLVDGRAEEPEGEQVTIEVEFEASDIEQMLFSSSEAGQAVVAHRVETSVGQSRTQLSRIDLNSGELVSTATLPDRARLLDVSPNGERALVRLTNGLEPTRRPVSTQTRLDIWELTEAEGAHRIGWEPGARPDGEAAIPLNAAFVDDDLVLSLCADGELSVWDPDQKAAIRSVATGSPGPMAVTPGRKGLFLFLGNSFALFEVETFKVLGNLDSPLNGDLNCLGVTVSSDGTQLGAILQRPSQEAVVWDLSNGKHRKTIPAPYDTRNLLHFGGTEHLLIGEILLSLEEGAPVWMYAQNASNRFLGSGFGADAWAVTQGNTNATRLVSYVIPDKALEREMAAPATSPRPDLGPGDSLAIQLSLDGVPEDLKNLQEALAQELGRVFADHGLKLQADAEYALEIRGASQKTGESIAFNAEEEAGGTSVPSHEIALTFALTRQSDQDTIWNESGRVPPVVLLEEEAGRTLEQILVRETWRSAPEAIADLLDQSFPLHVHAVPLTAQLRHGRMWIALDDVVIPESKESEGEQPRMMAKESSAPPVDYTAIDAPAHLPILTAKIGEGAVRDAVAAASGALATTSSDKYLRVWVPNQQRGTLQEFGASRTEEGPTCVSLDDATGDFLFGTESGSVRRFEVEKKRSILERDSLDGSVTAVAITSEPNFVAGTDKGRVSTWTGPRGSVEVLIDRNAPVTDIAAVPYTNRVVAAWADGVAMLLEVGTAKTVLTFDLKAGAIRDVTVSSNAQQVAFATETGGAVVASLLNGSEMGRIGSGEVGAVAFRPRTDELATSTPVDRIVLWDVKSQRPLNCYDAVGGDVRRIVFSPDGQGLAAVVAGRRNLPIWSVSGGGEGGSPAEP